MTEKPLHQLKPMPTMNNLVTNVPCVKDPIKKCPGFTKKLLAIYKIDILALCGFGCRYCSSNCGFYLRMSKKPFALLTELQTGKKVLPENTPSLTYQWLDILEELELQLSKKNKSWGKGDVLVFSMLTDGFSPNLLRDGTTRKVLELLLSKTSFRIRILTKNAIVGSPVWLEFFSEYKDRFVVGLSIGTGDDDWARRIEIGTSPPSERLKALSNLQSVGIPTYGMLCPIFPDTLSGDNLEKLVESINPEVCEHIWAEPYNDRRNWKIVRSGYKEDSQGWRWFTETYEQKVHGKWSSYATELYKRLLALAEEGGWVEKLRYLLYEKDIKEQDAESFRGFNGVLLQGKPDENGFSKNLHIKKIQLKNVACA